MTVGRDSSNRISFLDASVSRNHCVILREDDRYIVRDLHSHNGTVVNGNAVTEHVLSNHDRIRVGASIFEFRLAAAGSEVPRTAEISLEDLQIRKDAFTQLSELEVSSPDISRDRLARDFEALVTIATRLRGIRHSDSLLWQLVGVLLDLIPADRVAILAGDQSSSLAPAFAWDRESGPGIPVRISRTIVDRVMNKQKPVLINEVPEKMPPGSAHDLGIYSVLCVPMCTPDKQLGVIYLDTRTLGSSFDPGHLQLVSAIGTIAGLALENARSIELLERENEQLKAVLPSQFDIIGDTDVMKNLYRFIAKAAPTDSNVVIYGESGTGKELVARAIHRHSSRTDEAFVAINCAALTETLLESELFGYEKGAFTGAVNQKRGYLEVADGGTMFLDEIGELALSLQAKLLRVLQEREVVRVGGTRPIKVNLRVLAATNQPLSQLVKKGAFREDLFYRLNVVSCHVAPLRERRDDIPLLAQYFTRKFASKCSRRVTGLADDAIACLMNYDWPGNVRELENAIERAVVLGSGSQILRDDLPESLTEVSDANESPSSYHAEVARRKKELILQALKQTNQNFTEAARLLGIHPNYLHRLVRLLDLRSNLKASA